jgi:stage V sporulation protein SpoVS
MNDAIEGSDGEAVESTMRRVAGGLSDAVGQAKQAAVQAGDGIGELRQVIRAQPLTMAFLAIGIGYLLGHLSSRSIGR